MTTKTKNRVAYYTPNVFPVEVAFTMCPKAFSKELKRLEIKDDVPFILNDHSHATLHWFTHPKHGLMAFMCLDRTASKKRSLSAIVGLLAHEATHVWQVTKKHIGEKKAGIETEAYFIQAVTQCFFDAYLNQK